MIRCKSCNVELTNSSKKQICGCPNMTTIFNNTISAVDLSKVVMLNSINLEGKMNFLTNEDIMWQEHRRQRKVRKLDFEVR